MVIIDKMNLPLPHGFPSFLNSKDSLWLWILLCSNGERWPPLWMLDMCFRKDILIFPVISLVWATYCFVVSLANTTLYSYTEVLLFFFLIFVGEFSFHLLACQHIYFGDSSPS